MKNNTTTRFSLLIITLITLSSCSEKSGLKTVKDWGCKNIFHCITNSDLITQETKSYPVELPKSKLKTGSIKETVKSSINTFNLPGFNGQILGEPLIDNNRIYMLNSRGEIFSYSYSFSESGKIQIKLDWQADMLYNKFSNSDLTGGSIVKHNNKLYVTNGTEFIYVIDPTKGELISTMQLPNIVKTPVLVDGHNIIVKTIDNNILILNKTNGNITAKTSLVDYTLNFTSSYAPLIHGENLIEFSQSGRILIYNKNDLSPINEINISNHLKMIENEEYSLLGLVNKPVISDNKLFLNSKNSGILCIDLESKTILWHKAIPDPQKFIIRGNSIFVLTNGKQIAAINKETGDIGWVNSLFSPRKPSEAKSTTDYRYLELFEDKLVVASNDSIIYMINAISGKIETRRHLKSTTSLNKIYSGYKLEDKSSGKQNLVLFFDNGKAIRFNKPLVKK